MMSLHDDGIWGSDLIQLIKYAEDQSFDSLDKNKNVIASDRGWNPLN